MNYFAFILLFYHLAFGLKAIVIQSIFASAATLILLFHYTHVLCKFKLIKLIYLLEPQISELKRTCNVHKDSKFILVEVIL